MDITLEYWAAKHGVTPVALADLRDMLNCFPLPSVADTKGESEDAVSKELRLAASATREILCFRNNVGALQDEKGRWVRYGLANDSKAINKAFKSHDLIGIRRILVAPNMVGTHIGQFWSRECKRRDWKWAGTERELAQRKFGELVLSYGGDAAFATSGADV